MSGEEVNINAEPKKDTTDRIEVDKNQYSLYNYLKANTSVLFACISGVAAVLSFLLNYLASGYEMGRLQYWMVDAAYVKTDTKNTVFLLLLSVTMGFILLVAYMAIRVAAKELGSSRGLRSAVKRCYRNTKKTVKEDKKKAQKAKRKASQQLDEKNDPQNQVMGNALQNKKPAELEELKKIIRKDRAHILRITFSILLVILGSTILLDAIIVKTMNIPWNGFLNLAFIGLIAFAFVWWAFRSWREGAASKSKYNDLSYQQLKEELKLAEKAQFSLKINAKKKISNKSIGLIIVGIVLISILLIITINMCGAVDAGLVREFPIYTDETGTYVGVYNNGDALVLKAAEVDGDQITIDVRQQKVVPAADVSYEICTFETVIVTGKGGEK